MMEVTSTANPIPFDQVGSVLASDPQVSLAYLFGSAAREQTTPLSDVDIALVTEPTLSPHDQFHLELAAADALALHCGIGNADVRVINEAPLVLRGQVVTEGRLLFARDEVARVDFETRTRAEYFDFLPIAEQLREAFFDDVRRRGLHGQSA